MNAGAYGVLADAVVVLHLVFVLFTVCGGLLAWRWRWVAWLHAPALLWASYIEISGGICPLTPLENELRYLSGEAMYTGSFLAHYAWELLYPAELSRDMQVALGAALLLGNVLIYGVIVSRSRLARRD